MTSQDTPNRPGEDKPEGLSKYLKRMKTALRPRSGTKRQSVATLSDVTGPSQTTYAKRSAFEDGFNSLTIICTVLRPQPQPASRPAPNQPCPPTTAS